METVEQVLEYVAIAADLVGLAILLIGATKFVLSYVRFEFKNLTGRDCAAHIQNLRLPLSGYILLALEFMIVSDIINSMLSRTMEDFLLLGLLIVIRTALSFFLGQEMKEGKE